MTYNSSFVGHKLIRDRVSKELCDHIVTDLMISGEVGLLLGNSDVDCEQVIYAPISLEALLLSQKSVVEEIVGEKLHPSFSFLWIYKRGAELKEHKDRGTVDYVMTINLRSSSNDPFRLRLTFK